MTLVPLLDLAPYWIESSEVETREQSGTYIIGDEAVAGYRKAIGKAVAAECYMWDDLHEKEILTEHYGRRAPFTDIESAKSALQMIARPALQTRIIL